MYFFVFQVSSLNAAVLSVLVGVSNRRHLYPPMFQSIQFCEENSWRSFKDNCSVCGVRVVCCGMCGVRVVCCGVCVVCGVVCAVCFLWCVWCVFA